MTLEDIQRIEKKIANNEELLPEERCEGFSVDGDVVSDRAFHGYDENATWNEDDEFVFGKANAEIEAAIAADALKK